MPLWPFNLKYPMCKHHYWPSNLKLMPPKNIIFTNVNIDAHSCVFAPLFLPLSLSLSLYLSTFRSFTLTSRHNNLLLIDFHPFIFNEKINHILDSYASLSRSSQGTSNCSFRWKQKCHRVKCHMAGLAKKKTWQRAGWARRKEIVKCHFACATLCQCSKIYYCFGLL